MQRLLAFVAAAFAANAFAAATIATTPAIPTYGQSIGMELQGSDVLVYLPATRYTRSGNDITVEYEYVNSTFGPFGPMFGAPTLALGELPPGNYKVTARLVDMNQPDAPAQVVTTNVPVLPPQDWGLYAVPRAPLASDRVNLVVRSAAYFDPASMHATVSGNTVRVDFAYRASAPTAGDAPPGLTSFGSVDVGRLAPGVYHAEGWGRPDTGGEAQRYFTLDFTVGGESNVVEYYNGQLDHYFMAAGGDEIDLVDGGGQGDWKRTGQSFHAWLRQQDAPPGAQPVCRFYARGPNSHFYTGDAAECAGLRALEQAQRASAEASGTPFLGWGYEGIAFWALVPVNGQCSTGVRPVWRNYNDRASEDDSNHRFTVDPLQHLAMQGWIDEGPVFCSPP
jgi:serine protease